MDDNENFSEGVPSKVSYVFKQNAQLKLLRQRYLSEIIRFELNTVRSEVLRKSAEYRRKSLEQNRDIRDEIARLP
ncbi:hypothetical protein QQ045_003926 [Rhodiola kirilowii]